MVVLTTSEIFNLVIAPLGAFINGLLTTIILLNRQLWTHTNTILAAISGIGVFYNLIIHPLQAAINRGYLHPLCSICGGTMFTTYVALFWLECGIAIERAIFVFNPLRYHSLVTHRRVLIYIITVCIYSGTLSSAVYFFPEPKVQELLGTKSYQLAMATNTSFDTDLVKFLKCTSTIYMTTGYVPFLMYGNCIPALCISSFLFSLILYTAGKLARKTGSLNCSQEQQPYITGKQKHTVAILLACNVTRAILWAPVIIFFTVDLNLLQTFHFRPPEGHRLQFYNALPSLPLLSTIIAPSIFAIMQSDFRQILNKLLCRCCKERVANIDNTSLHNTQHITTG